MVKSIMVAIEMSTNIEEFGGTEILVPNDSQHTNFQKAQHESARGYRNTVSVGKTCPISHNGHSSHRKGGYDKEESITASAARCVAGTHFSKGKMLGITVIVMQKTVHYVFIKLCTVL